MMQVVTLTVFALLLARVIGAPKGTWRYIVGAAVAVLAASQFLPAGNEYRADVAGSARLMFWIGLGLVPVAAYALFVRRLRRRLGSDEAFQPPRPQGLVQFPDDGALSAATAAALFDEAEALGKPVSLGWRGEDGALEGHLRLRLRGDVAEIEMLRVEPAHRRQGVGGALLRAAETEARTSGARRIGALVGDWQAPAFFSRAGYAATGAGGGRTWMEKAL